MTTQFQDFNFKLAVIQVLMYEDELLQPAFELREFVKAHTARTIDLEEEGYGIIPEAQAFFANLEIPAHLLHGMTAIYQDGGDDIYHQLYPFWDGEDEFFTIKSVTDVALLPNLRKVVLFYDDDERIAKEFTALGIEADYC